jgi:predicted glycogen debranching enzyme
MVFTTQKRWQNLTRSGLPKIYMGLRSLSDLDKATRLEWIVTNGLGGYASSTVLNINTRKYHGLLVAAFNPPVGRHVLLSKVDEEVHIRGDGYQLGSNEFREVIHPKGYDRFRNFSLNPFPTFNYGVSGFSLKKEVFMPHAENTTIIRYEAFNSLDDEAVITVHPLVSMRHFYETTKRHIQQAEITQEPIRNGVIIERQPLKGYLAIFCTDSRYITGREKWIEEIHLRMDSSRGEDCTDDNYQLGLFKLTVPRKERKEFYLAAVGGRTRKEVISRRLTAFRRNVAKKLYAEEIARRERLLEKFYENKCRTKAEDWLNWLVLSADTFIVTRKSTGRKSVIAGYHWFEDWGRDTLISLPGLTLVTGKFRDAEDIFLTFKQYCRDGLIPNRFPDRSGDEPVYNSVDATLWFFNAVLQYLKYTRRFDFVHRVLWDTLRDIVEKHIRGTAFGIHMDEDGLLAHGPRLTWMDVSIDGKPVTAREGKAVEVQALWYNTLRIMEMLASKFGQDNSAERYSCIAEKARMSFNEKFWWLEGGYLLDTVEKEKSDPSLRPNQIIAAYLDFSLLDNSRGEKVVDAVWRSLWGTYGLKSLSSDDSKYIGRYVGGFVHREMAYHNGTVWAWLLGPFVTSFLKVKNHGEYWRRFAFEKFLQPLFLEETYRAGLGTLSEIFDGDPPHSPKGCISQAWSVAEPLRAFVEDILLERPPYEKALKCGRQSGED